MKVTRRSSLWLLLVVAAIAGLAYWAFQPRPVLVEMREIAEAAFEQTIDEQGKTRVRDRYTISAPIAGELDRIRLDAGDRVERGTVVAQIRAAPPSLRDTRTMTELRERVGAAEAARLRAEANEARVRAAVELATYDYERTQRLASQGFVSRSAQDQARLMLAQQTQALKAAEFERDAAVHELEMARAAQSRSGRDVVAGKLEIRSPVAARVLRVIQQSEAVVVPGTPLLEVGDPESMEAVIDVLSQDAPRIEPGMKVRMSVSPALPALPGRVRRVEPSARTKISTLGVEEQRVSVIVDFTTSAAQLGDGYRIDAAIVVLERERVPVAPIGALFRDGDRWAVFVAVDGVARRREVRVEARNQQAAWIGDGLSPGEVVIVYPPETVRDGARIAAR